MYTLRNSRIEMQFDDGGRLVVLQDRTGAFRAPIDPAALTELFEVQIRDSEGKLTSVTPQGPAAVRTTRNTFSATWQLSGSWGSMDVTSKVTLKRGSPAGEWRLDIVNHTDAALWQVAYPRLSGLTEFPDVEGPSWLAVPFQMGEKNPHPVYAVNHAEKQIDTWARSQHGCFDVEGGGGDIAYSYPGMWTTQFMAYGHPSVGGIYYAAHDGQALYKRFGMYADTASGEHAALVMKQFPKDRTARCGDFASFYPVMIGVYEGDWWGASAIYREWALKQKWCRKGPTRNRRDIPDWAKQLDLWYWNWQWALNGHPDDIVPAIEYLKKDFECEIAFHWYGYGGEGYSWHQPECLPANKDNLGIMLRGVRRLHESGIHCIPYIQGRRWAPDCASFRKANGMDWIATDEKGRPSEPLNSRRHTMCPTARCHHDILRKVTMQMVDQGEMDGAYLDVISSCFSVPCFNAHHNHPPGGHDHWCRGYRENLRKIRRRAKQKSTDIILTSESVIECYLDLLDLDLAREISSLRGFVGCPDSVPIPMFHSVYHDYHMTYGTVSTFKPRASGMRFSLDAFRLQEALTLVGGGQLMISGFFPGDENKEQFQPQLAFMKTLTGARKAARAWFNFGAWKPPVNVDCEQVEVDVSTSPDPALAQKRTLPAVLSGAFELDGTLCVALVNHTDTPRRVRARLDASVYGLAGADFRLTSVWPGEERLLDSSSPLDYETEMPSCSAFVWMVKPAAGPSS